MNETDLNEIISRSMQLREKYHILEKEHHGSTWTVEEDALAFLTDAALVGRLTMAQQKRWPADDNDLSKLKHKLGESIWWIIVLAERMGMSSKDALLTFLSNTEAKL